ncbi:hypothetical protein DFH11DRAFT_1512491 [Phellopilus nigrolimitatus]|nr:hypothetical protein DFH11DRAFT_1512491 [Phellopilus nigrolimitatus]
MGQGHSTPTHPSPPSPLEVKFYYAGLPSSPLLVARTCTTPWEAPRGPEAYRVLKEVRPVGNHPLADVWEDNLALKLHALLDSMDVEWTSTDVVRIGLAKEPSAPAPVILWIGVFPKSLSGDDGVAVVYKCRELLVEFDIADVDVEIRESVVTRSAGPGPKLLKPTRSSDFTERAREPLTTTLGLPICAQSTPCVEGTGGFFIGEGEGEGGNAERLLLVTARHVLFPPDKNENSHFERKSDSQPRYNVRLFGDAALNKHLESIETEIGKWKWLIQEHKRYIREAEGKDNRSASEKRQKYEAELDKAQNMMEKVKTFHQYMSTHWAAPESRVLGHVVLSPPISVGSSSKGEGYTEDWAVIEIDASKIDASNFSGNVIDLGTRIPLDKFTFMMCPNDPWGALSFTYPFDRLLRLSGTIPDDEMRHPTTALDQNGQPCPMVIKRGNTSDVTIGCANNILSYARNYYNDNDNDNDNSENLTSKEWAILPRKSNCGPFSENGDSGSVIVDGCGRIGGLLTGGAGGATSFSESELDITYATPVGFILKRLQEHGLHNPHINPVLVA